MNHVKKIATAAIVNLLVVFSVYGGGRVEEANFSFPIQVEHISPQNKDGVQDDIKIDIANSIQSAKKRRLEEVYFKVYNTNGDEEISETFSYEDSPTYTFDGSRSEGSYLEDGYYVYTLGVKDDKGNVSISQPFPVHIDNTPPTIRSAELTSGNIVSFQNSVSSEIAVQGSEEVDWQYFIVTEDGSFTTIFEQVQSDPASPPEMWIWFGIDASDNIITDGSYTVRVQARDEAGNVTTRDISSTVVVTEEGAVTLAPIDGVAFSPNDDGRKDSLFFGIDFSQGEKDSFDAFRKWQYIVTDERGIEDLYSIPIEVDATRIEFLGNNENGIAIQDGNYKIQLEFEKNGVMYRTNSVSIEIDTLAPQASVLLRTTPVGLGAGDPLYIGGDDHSAIEGRFRALEDFRWTFMLTKGEGGDIPLIEEFVALDENKTYPFKIGVNDQIKGESLGDGMYSLSFYAEDEAGNVGGVLNVSFTRDTQEKTLSVTPNRTSVSAYGSPINFVVDYTLEGIKDFKVSITDAQDRTLFSNTSYRTGLKNFNWNGYSDSEIPVQDGEYSYRVSVSYYNGASNSVKGDITVDSIPPELNTFEYSSELINPKDNSAKNKTLDVTQSSVSEDAMWLVEIRNIFEQVVFSQDMGNALANVSWDGKDTNDQVVPDGDYIYQLVGRDIAGNTVTGNIAFIVDTGAYNKGRILKIDGEMPRIFFPAYSEDIFSYGDDPLLYENLLNIRSVANLLKAYPEKTLSITGHAAALLRGSRGKVEQAEVLIPLSRGRVKQINRALVILGVDESRITTRAVGGLYPLIENPTSENIWKNRRVEFNVEQVE